MKFLLGFLYIAFSSMPTITLGDYQSFSLGLTEQSEKMREAAGLIDRGAIYSDKVIQDTFYIPGNSELREAGKEFIDFLKSNKSNFDRLETSDWIRAINEMLEFDDWNANKIAWGNLIIKCYISDIIMRSIYLRLTTPGQLDKEAYPDVIDIIRRLRMRLPSEKAMYSIAFRHYDYEKPFELDRLDYFGTNIGDSNEYPEKSLRRAEKILKHEESTHNRFPLIHVEETEIAGDFIGYRDLYENPVPFSLGLYSRYREIIWDLHFYALLIVQVNGEVKDLSLLEKRDLDAVLKILSSEEKFWMDDEDRFFMDKKLEYVLARHLKKIQGRYRLYPKWFWGSTDRRSSKVFVVHELEQ